MFGLLEKPAKEVASAPEVAVPEKKAPIKQESNQLNVYLDYLCLTLTGPSKVVFRERVHYCFFEDWFDFSIRQNLRAVYDSLLRANRYLARVRGITLNRCDRSDGIFAEMRLTDFYSKLDNDRIERAVANSNSRSMTWLAQQCITLCDHLLRQVALKEETDAALEEDRLSSWLRVQAQTKWEPGASSFNSDSPSVNDFGGPRSQRYDHSEAIDFFNAAEAAYYEAEAEAESMAEEPDSEACAEEGDW